MTSVTAAGRHAGQRVVVKALPRVAERHQAGIGQVVIAWLLRRSPAILPIPGTSSIRHLEENAAAAALRLSDEDMKQLG